MNFNEAFSLMKKGYKIKLPSWYGYWCWEDNTIMMYCKDGKILDIRETEAPEYTFSNIASDEWIVANDENTPYWGGVALFGFNEAIKYLKRGFKVSRRSWNSMQKWLIILEPNKAGESFGEYPLKSYIAMKTEYNAIIPWNANQLDLLAEDWQIVD